MRLDQFLVQKYGFTRNKAQAIISLGLVSIDGKKAKKSSHDIVPGCVVEIIEDRSIRWVSRSAGKLDGFLDELGVRDVSGKRALDIGSSTGGFTQILLERNISHVDAVDVGTDQLAEILRKDPRVSSYEQTDIRTYSTQFQGDRLYDIIVCDVSFISLHEIISSILGFMGPDTHAYLLFKPQFEVGRECLRKTGVPKTEASIKLALLKFEQLLNHKCLKIIKKSKASVLGESGNQEWMYFLQRAEV